jgi:hypothetical protein
MDVATKKKTTPLSVVTSPSLFDPQPFSFFKTGNKLGLISGILMSLFLFALDYLALGSSSGMKMLKYVILGGILLHGLRMYKHTLPKGQIFKQGILFGAYTTFVSALTLIAAILVAYSLIPDFSLIKFSLEAATLKDILLLEGVVFFEILIFGMILTFIWLQYLKDRKPAE